MYECKILADSVSPSKKRLTTFVVTYPRSIHSELMTHRMASKSSSSSRAIPIKKLMAQIEGDPALPVYWGSNKSGMQAGVELESFVIDECRRDILAHRDAAVELAARLEARGMHKQDANRYLEPWMFITVIVSATEWGNFFRLRCHKDAHPSFLKIAQMMQMARAASKPHRLQLGDWHMPFASEETIPSEAEMPDLLICTARCARVSYLTHTGEFVPSKDVDLAKKLIESGHWSPFEHVARCTNVEHRSGNFLGWEQLRESLDPNFLDEDSFGEFYDEVD